MSNDAKAEETEAKEAITEAVENGEEEAIVAEASGLKAKLVGKLKYIIIGVVGLLLIGGGVGGYFLGLFHTPKPHETTVILPGAPVFYELEPIVVDIKPEQGRARPFIRLGLQVELQGESAKEAFIANEIKIKDLMQSHLRTVAPSDLSGQEGTARLREDLVRIMNRIIAPERAITVFYKDIIVR
ncbi:MAG: flagellar basal body-associated FliL family protein [Magnetovibrio sp.]|nr:flagellar basal body-associated FliL family protein [Magnetovibrio sp.]